MPLPFLIGGLIAAATSAAAGTVATVGAVAATVGTAAAAAGTAAATTAAAIGTAAASTAVGSAAIGAASTVGTAVAAAGTAAAGTAVGSAAIGAMSTVGTAVGTAAAAASSVPVIGTAASGIAAVAGTTAGSAALGTITTTGAIGAVSGISGAVKLSEAEDIKNSAVARYDAACAALKNEQNHTNSVLETLGKTKLQVWESFDIFSHLYAQIKNPPVIKGTVEQEALSLTLEELQEIKVLAISARDIIRGGIGSVAAGNLIGLATSGGLVGTITAASTGTAMSALSGAAASNAALAAFGGGALKVGGLGMAGGATVLGALTVAPMLMVGGLALHSKGGKALENAKEIENEANHSIQKISEIMPELKKVRELAEKIQDTLNNLHNCYHTILNSLSNIVSSKTNYLDFSIEEKKTLERTVLCTKLLKELTLQNILNPEKENEVLDKEVNRTLAHSHEMFKQIEPRTNQCPQCGAKMPSSTVFCEACGAMLTNVETEHTGIERTEEQCSKIIDPATAEAEIDHVYLDNGTKGYRTIQIQLKHPVFLDEVRYDHIPVLSKDLFDKLGLREDSVITVHRVGDVIPAISVKTEGKGKLLKAPVQCTCHEFLKVRNGKLFCDNPLCRMNQVGRMVGFFIGIGLDDYNEAFANTIIDFSTNRPNTFNYVDLSDLFKLTPDKFAAGGYTTKTYTEFQDKLRAAVAKTPDYQVLGSVGISDLGPARAKQILREYKGDWDALAKDVCYHNASRIIKALGWTIGSKVVESMDSMIGLCSTLNELKEHMENFSSTKDYDLRVGHTGFTPSQALRDFCEQRNMELVDGKSFDILIADSLNSISGKAQVARKKNLPVFTESLFLKQYEDYGKPMTKEDHPINHYVTTASWSHYYVNAFELMEGVC